MPITHSIQCPCLQAADRTSQLIHFLEHFLTHGHARNNSLSWRPFEWQPWVLIKTLLMASEKATQMNLSRKNRIYQKELGIFHGIQRRAGEGSSQKTLKPETETCKNNKKLPQSLPLSMTSCPIPYLFTCLLYSFLSTNCFFLFSVCAA